MQGGGMWSIAAHAYICGAPTEEVLEEPHQNRRIENQSALTHRSRSAGNAAACTQTHSSGPTAPACTSSTCTACSWHKPLACMLDKSIHTVSSCRLLIYNALFAHAIAMSRNAIGPGRTAIANSISNAS